MNISKESEKATETGHLILPTGDGAAGAAGGAEGAGGAGSRPAFAPGAGPACATAIRPAGQLKLRCSKLREGRDQGLEECCEHL